MANLDTQNKRRSAANMPLFVIPPVADGTIGARDRIQAAGWYSGIPIANLVDTGVYSPYVLVDVFLDSGTHRLSTRDLYRPGDIFYRGLLIDAPTVHEELSDLYYGVEQSSSVTLQFKNPDNGIDDTWDTIAAAEELRGKWIRILRHDPADQVAFEFRGKITGYTLGTVLEIVVEMRDDEILETLLPLKIVTTDEFTATALDVGQVVNICFGHCRNVPLRNIQNNTSANEYDYLIGYGTIESLWIDTGIGVKRDGKIVSPAGYTFYDGSQGSPYPGYAFLRFTTEQIDASDRYYNLTADVKGLEMGGTSAERSFANVVKNLLSDTTWGLSDNIDVASFEKGVTDLNTIGDMYCDGAITSQQQARDILNNLLFPARATVERGADGEWEISVDGPKACVAYFGENDGYYNNCEVLSVSVTPTNEALKTLTLHYGLDPSNEDKPFYELEEDVHSNFGVSRTYELPFVMEADTAEKVKLYLKNRSLYSDKIVSLMTGMEGRHLSRGDVINLTVPARNIGPKEYQVKRISKDLTQFILDCQEFNENTYNDESARYSVFKYGAGEYGTKYNGGIVFL